MTFFKIMLGFDAIVALIVFYFFYTGITDGTVSVSNIGLWLLLLGAFAAIIWGGLWLKSRKKLLLANLLLCIVAVPGLLYLAFILVLAFGHVSWQ